MENKKELQNNDYCPYCNAKLKSVFYFCTKCAVPYKDVATVIPPHTKRTLSYEESVRLKAPHATTLFWTYFSTVFVFAVFFSFLPQDQFLGIKLIIPGLTIMLITLIFSVLFWKSLINQFKEIGFFNKYFIISIIGLAILLGINYGYHKIFYTFFSSLEWDLSYIKYKNTGMNLWVIITFYCVIPAITEEIAFRGLLQHWLTAALSPQKAILISSALFATLHFSLISFPYLFLVGLFFSWVKLRTSSLYPVIIFHCIHNFVVINYFNIGNNIF